MPKILPNVQNALLEEAKRQISQNGYRDTTIRSVAKACGLAVGTVYNYFPSKDVLIATFMAQEWLECLKRVKTYPEHSSFEVLESLYNVLTEFSARHKSLFCDESAHKVFATVFSQRHKQLRAQLAQFILPMCKNKENSEFLAEFIAESLLSWTVSGQSFENQYAIIKNLL
ncbi:MAG: TetR/AcrR family transcriptional regulator [Clostridia bacterium]|nr:TetR/AcrR family transcriptional regulator [Clostridia bacterium]